MSSSVGRLPGRLTSRQAARRSGGRRRAERGEFFIEASFEISECEFRAKTIRAEAHIPQSCFRLSITIHTNVT
jgi:hypothetical protein